MRIDQSLLVPFFFRLRSSRDQIFPSGCLDSRFLRQTLQELVLAGSVVPPHNRAHRRVGFQRRRIDRHRLALHQFPVGQ